MEGCFSFISSNVGSTFLKSEIDMQLSESKLHFNLISLGSCISSAEIKIIIASDLAAFLANLFQNITDDRQ